MITSSSEFSSSKNDETSTNIHSQSFAYGGAQIHVVDENEIAFVCGRGIKFLNLTTLGERYFWPPNWVKDETVKKVEEEAEVPVDQSFASMPTKGIFNFK